MGSVTGENRRTETERSGVGEFDGLFFGVDDVERRNRAEELRRIGRVVGLDAGENSCFDVEPVAVDLVSAKEDLGPVVTRDPDLVENGVECPFGRQRPKGSGLVGGVADLQARHVLLERVQESFSALLADDDDAL